MTKKEVGWLLPGGVWVEPPVLGYCTVCGAPVKAQPSSDSALPGGIRWRIQANACASSYCQVSAELNHELFYDKSRRKKQAPKKNNSWDPRGAWQRQSTFREARTALIRYTPYLVESADKTEILLMFVRVHFSSSMWFIDNQWLGSDERGALNEGVQRESVWHPNSRVKSALKAIGGAPALSIECPLTENASDVLVRELAGSNRFIHSFDYLMVWRCGCPQAHEVKYKTVADLPTHYGYHHACTTCNQAPLEIIRPKPKRKKRGTSR